MDRRQQKTRKAIISAFEELISAKPYNDITVQEIIDLADVGRTTFYAHFETKDSVLDTLCEELFQHIFEEAPAEEKTHDFSSETYSEDAMMTHILYHLKEDRTQYARLFQGESADIFWERFKARFESELSGQAGKNRWEVPGSIPEDLYWDLYVAAFVEIVRWWFGHLCHESPEEVERYFDMFCR